MPFPDPCGDNMSRIPNVGDIVHYVSYGTPGGEYPSVCRAAIVTHVHEGEQDAYAEPIEVVGLAVLNPEGMFFNQRCEHSEDVRYGGTWHWPENSGIRDLPDVDRVAAELYARLGKKPDLEG